MKNSQAKSPVFLLFALLAVIGESRVHSLPLAPKRAMK